MAGVIKADRVGGDAALQVTAFNFEDVTQKAARYLEAVRVDAENVLAQARDEAAQLRQRAEQEGYAAGLAAARELLREEVEQRLATAVPALEQTLHSLAEAERCRRRQHDVQLVHLARKMAERVIRRQLRQDPQISVAWAREALELVAGCQRITVGLHPEDHELLEPYVRKLFDQLGLSAAAETTADPQVPAGGCVVRTEYGEVDQRLETQLDRLEEELTE